MVDGERELERCCGGELTVVHDSLLPDSANGEDRSLRRIDDGSEVVDAVHPEIADGECATRQIVGCQLAGACPLDKGVCVDGVLAEALSVRVTGITATRSPSSTSTAQPMFTWL